jgi:hypothetical protein
MTSAPRSPPPKRSKLTATPRLARGASRTRRPSTRRCVWGACVYVIVRVQGVGAAAVSFVFAAALPLFSLSPLTHTTPAPPPPKRRSPPRPNWRRSARPTTPTSRRRTAKWASTRSRSSRPRARCAATQSALSSFGFFFACFLGGAWFACPRTVHQALPCLSYL